MFDICIVVIETMNIEYRVSSSIIHYWFNQELTHEWFSAV